jgi:predicted enzyme related to lactoylglutathione lyase
MLQDSPAFSGFSVNDIDAAEQFYGSTLGLSVKKTPQGIEITTGNQHTIFAYPKEDHVPATYTILNFPVDDIKTTVDGLKSKGVNFEMYPNMTDENGIAWGSKVGMGPDIAWFKDPAGNFLAVMGKDPSKS